jgi:hypothetical protein
LREAQEGRGAQGIEAEILADFAKQNPLDWSEKPPSKTAIRTGTTQCWHDALSLILRIAESRVLSG